MFDNFTDSLFRQAGISILYHGKYGVKSIHQMIASDHYKYFQIKATETLPANKLLIGIDGLKDRFTSLGKPIVESPHFQMMQLLNDNKDISNCDYIRTIKIGALDTRKPVRVTNHFKDYLKNQFILKKQAVLSGRYEPAKIIRFGNQIHVIDGRHTAALCSLYAQDITCMDVTLAMYDSYFYWMYQKMLQRKDQYGIHINFWKEFYK